MDPNEPLGLSWTDNWGLKNKELMINPFGKMSLYLKWLMIKLYGDHGLWFGGKDKKNKLDKVERIPANPDTFYNKHFVILYIIIIKHRHIKSNNYITKRMLQNYISIQYFTLLLHVHKSCNRGELV